MATSSSPDRPLTVGVLGSARLAGDDPRCTLARQTGARLAEQGWTVVTGGYAGLMEQVSRGAAEANGHVVGLPMRHWNGLAPNSWNTELRWARDYPERLGHLLACDAVVALDGGIGTLAETTVAWSALQTESAAPAIVAVGHAWRAMLAAIERHLVVAADDLAHLTVVDHADEVVPAIRAAIATSRTALPRG